MVTVDELRSALERVARQEGRAGDLQLLRQALARGEITAATGERAVAIGVMPETWRSSPATAMWSTSSEVWMPVSSGEY
jgi:Effector-associated domain 10